MHQNFKIVIVIIMLSSLHIFNVDAQQIEQEELVQYTKTSNFIKEFKIPLDTLGLKGITTDSQGNAWFYHATNVTSTIIKFEPETGIFTTYSIEGQTQSNDPIINLAGGMIIYDKSKNLIWFTDARTNSIGNINIESGKVQLVSIPTKDSGPMGIVLSLDEKSIWFSEIIANKIAKLDVQTGTITEYSTGEQSGPTFLTFDNNGELWITLSYSHEILHVKPKLLDSDLTSAMSKISLPPFFSPFGIAVVDDTGTQKIFFSDHGSNRIISVDVNSNFDSFKLYWTSPSHVYPQTLPGQIVADKAGNIYFPQHGGNRISKINLNSDIMTEYDIPTGPLSTVVFIAVSEDGKRVWFAEVMSNKVAYLDTTLNVPFNLHVQSDKLTLDYNGQKTIDVLLTANEDNASLVSLSEVELGVIGMTESGLEGIMYNAQPQRVDLTQNKIIESKIDLLLDEKAKAGDYNIMVRAIAAENDQLLVSQLYPISITLDIPTILKEAQLDLADDKKIESNNQLLYDSTRMVALVVAIGLIGFLIYNRAKKKETS